MNSPSTNKLNDASRQEDSVKEKCNDPRCMEALQLIIDGQATEADDEFFKAHITNCMPCFKKYQLEKTIKDVLVLKVEKKKVPVELINSIKDKIKAITV
jgi:anti-sigma factor (TIGR02949 family)